MSNLHLMELIPLFQTPCARSLLKILQNTLTDRSLLLFSLWTLTVLLMMLTILAGFSIVSIHPPPAFGSSPNLEALALEANKSKDQDGDSSLLDSSHLSRSCQSSTFLPQSNASPPSLVDFSFRPMHEATFSTEDKPKLLSQV
ncbi:hypothetical protein ES332_D02G152300v1 [Gossypium tomentosum]|uniref:Uncharacterized protein n=1 Tax=Gossypium tomentosum TaxID=34277 RepID=A0A5D2LXF5_GOSTO|nr:hypothetical protein ES332_D02G152300v1 [Gossypium tomentosum]